MFLEALDLLESKGRPVGRCPLDIVRIGPQESEKKDFWGICLDSSKFSLFLNLYSFLGVSGEQGCAQKILRKISVLEPDSEL